MMAVRQRKRGRSDDDDSRIENISLAWKQLPELARQVLLEGCELLVSSVQLGTPCPHWIFRTGGRDVLQVWPATTRFWAPGENRSGTLSSIWDALSFLPGKVTRNGR
jgi:hypothetical protein